MTEIILPDTDADAAPAPTHPAAGPLPPAGGPLSTPTSDERPAPPKLSETRLRLGIPKGRMYDGVVALLADAGIRLATSSRGYRPRVSLAGAEAKILKPQNIVEMLHAGARDAGFAGCDWVTELQADLVDLLDTGLDPVRIVAAAPRTLIVDGPSPAADGRAQAGASPANAQPGGADPADDGSAWTEPAAAWSRVRWPDRPIVIASEYERLTAAWIARRKLSARFLRSYGATEVLPPEDADCIVDVAASGATLEANGLTVIDELMRSSTRLYASPQAMRNPAKRAALDDLTLVLRSVLDARQRVMLEVNVAPDNLEAVCAALPCMREPTIARLHGDAGYAVKAAVPRERLPRLIPIIKAQGGTDIVITSIAQVVP